MDTKMNLLMPSGKKKVTFEVLLDDMGRVGGIPSEQNRNEDWVKRYENWTYMLQKSYEEALQKEKLDEVFTVNRKLGKIAKLIREFALPQENAYLYSMGTFVGVFHAMASMLPKRNKEQIFNIRMAELMGRVYVKQVLEALYRHDYTQHKDLCDKLGIRPSQLNRIMGELDDIGCIKQYRSGKYAFYSLTPRGEKYAHEFLGCGKEEYVDYESVMLAGQKPQIDRKEQKFSISEQMEEYRIDSRENMMKYGKFISEELSYPKSGFERNIYE